MKKQHRVYIELVDYWLERAYNTSHTEIVNSFPEYTDVYRLISDYPVTDAIRREWLLWAKDKIKKEFHLNKKLINQIYTTVITNLAPNVDDNTTRY